MPVFYFLIVVGAIVLWFLLAFLFKPIGKFFSKIGNDAINEMKDEEEENENE